MTQKLSHKHGRKIQLKDLGLADFIAAYNQLFEHEVCSMTQYQRWITESEPKLWSRTNPIELAARDNSPSFSIVVPTYNAKSEWLNACIESVLAQNYSKWQLVVVDDASTCVTIKACLNEWQAKSKAEPRIQIIQRDLNGHISAATNTGLSYCTGDYICFLDHDDMLSPHALHELADIIIQSPDIKLIYSDEDLMTEAGERVTPHFKSGWNPELLLAHNYLTHLCCYRRTFVNQLGGFGVKVNGAQDYDLALRASRELDASEIRHIPKVLYHWRMVEGSTATSSDAKPYTDKAGLNALNAHLEMICPGATAEYTDRAHFYRVRWPLPAVLPKVAVIIPTRNGLEVLKPCIVSLLSTDYQNMEVVIVDNGSDDVDALDYLHSLKHTPGFKVIRDDGEFNYSRINNLAADNTDAELLCLLNNDTEIISADWLKEMVTQAIRPEVGCVGAKLLYPDDTIQHAGVVLGLGGYAAHSHRGIERHAPGYFCRAQLPQNLSAVTAACLVVKKSIYDEVGGLTESFEVAYNDVDFCLKVMKAGYRNLYTPYAELYHHESKTRGQDTSPEKNARFDREKARLSQYWQPWLDNDPYYNPNLTRSREDFSIG
ncbi:glycosyltransferase family 2 protein [Shewanella corallii]|uniref:Glycosyltransferase family 2 protein n=1 Tax=Shewanella corallii TaxID=560080 RepID=A0ABT0N6W2_9GAMM|nr:glycosyltransferase family 2 protein [Shewanella corallii]MCL2914159.1 glycosyltransferase family 2 protein [Shewanella corallii]